VSLVRYGQDLGGEPRGGYANQLTYEVFDGDWQTVYINAPVAGDGGFGYFVSHEIFRNFDAGACPNGTNNCTIAALHNQEDDSPLSLTLPGQGNNVLLGETVAVHQFDLNYPHWGTTVAVPDPEDSTTPSDPAQHKKYDLPVRIRWQFMSGEDYPLWGVNYDLSQAPIDTVSADVRGPYGNVVWDQDGGLLTKLEWGDTFKFATTGDGVSTQSEWNWNTPNPGARYNLLVAANGSEMGLVDTIPYTSSRTGNALSSHRNGTSDAGPGCPATGWRMPCASEWTYQSIQFEDFVDAPTSQKKIAWGSAPYMGTSRTTDAGGAPILGYPSVSYTVWITFDRSNGANTRALADSIGKPDPGLGHYYPSLP
jgi:hypothetical protein